MKLLLHICCAPCLIFPLERLQEEGHEVMGFFYNPNIHPQEEYQKRREEVEILSRELKFDVVYPDYNPQDFFSQVKPDMGFPGRCPICWELRLLKTAQAAKGMELEGFTTTLLVSPYQDQLLLRGIGERIEEEENISFFYEDFRPGFKAAHEEAKKKGIYCQKYCGCTYSLEERSKKPRK